MKKKIKYGNEKIGKVKIVKDFLPNPKDLTIKQSTGKKSPLDVKGVKVKIKRDEIIDILREVRSS